MSDSILSVKELRTSISTDNGEVMAVNGISFDLDRGKILGIVGESGSGKSVTAYSIMRILESNGGIKGGHVFYKGDDMLFHYFPGSHDQPESCIHGWKPAEGGN